MQICAHLYAKRPSDSYHTGLDVISIIFMLGRKYEKHTGKGTDDIISIPPCAAASYAYSRYVNVCQIERRGGKKQDITAGRVRTLHSRRARRIRSWFCCSAHRSLLDSPTLLQSIAVQADVPWLRPILTRFHIFFFPFPEKVALSRRGFKVSPQTGALPGPLTETEGRLVSSFYSGRGGGGEEISQQRAPHRRARKQFTRLPHL